MVDGAAGGRGPAAMGEQRGQQHGSDGRRRDAVRGRIDSHCCCQPCPALPSRTCPRPRHPRAARARRCRGPRSTAAPARPPPRSPGCCPTGRPGRWCRRRAPPACAPRRQWSHPALQRGGWAVRTHDVCSSRQPASTAAARRRRLVRYVAIMRTHDGVVHRAHRHQLLLGAEGHADGRLLQLHRPRLGEEGTNGAGGWARRQAAAAGRRRRRRRRSADCIVGAALAPAACMRDRSHGRKRGQGVPASGGEFRASHRQNRAGPRHRCSWLHSGDCPAAQFTQRRRTACCQCMMAVLPSASCASTAPGRPQLHSSRAHCRPADRLRNAGPPESGLRAGTKLGSRQWARHSAHTRQDGLPRDGREHQAHAGLPEQAGECGR